MGVISDLNTYLKFLSTTSLTLEELNLYIMTVEEAKKSVQKTKGTWQVVTSGHGGETVKVRMILDRYLDNNNGGNGNGAV